MYLIQMVACTYKGKRDTVPSVVLNQSRTITLASRIWWMLLEQTGWVWLRLQDGRNRRIDRTLLQRRIIRDSLIIWYFDQGSSCCLRVGLPNVGSYLIGTIIRLGDSTIMIIIRSLKIATTALCCGFYDWSEFADFELRWCVRSCTSISYKNCCNYIIYWFQIDRPNWTFCREGEGKQHGAIVNHRITMGEKWKSNTLEYKHRPGQH